MPGKSYSSVRVSARGIKKSKRKEMIRKKRPGSRKDKEKAQYRSKCSNKNSI